VLAEVDLAASAPGAAAVLQRTCAADLAGEVRTAEPGLRDADLDGLPGRAGDRAGLQVDLELSLAEAILCDLALWDRGEHLHITLGQFASDRPVTVGGIAEHPAWSALRRLGIDQVLGLLPVGLTPGLTCTAVISGSLLFVAEAESL
jgi:hypothetical protein